MVLWATRLSVVGPVSLPPGHVSITTKSIGVSDDRPIYKKKTQFVTGKFRSGRLGAHGSMARTFPIKSLIRSEFYSENPERKSGVIKMPITFILHNYKCYLKNWEFFFYNLKLNFRIHIIWLL